MKKPGFFKRIFSFGRKKQEEASIETEAIAHPLSTEQLEPEPSSGPDDDNSLPTEAETSSDTNVDKIQFIKEKIDSPPKQSTASGHDSGKDEATHVSLQKDPEKAAAKDTADVVAEIIDDQKKPATRDTFRDDTDKVSTGNLDAAEKSDESEPVSVTESSFFDQKEVIQAGDTTGHAPSETLNSENPQMVVAGSDLPPPNVVPLNKPEKPGIHITTKSVDFSTDDNAPAVEENKSWFKRLSQGLSRTSSQLNENIAAVFTKKKLDDAALQDLEDILLQADLGFDTATNIVDTLAKQRMGKNVTDEDVRSIMAEEIEAVLSSVAKPLELDLDHKPHVILVVGVNGSGKTTTIGKLSQKLHDGGYSSMLVAGDTFRAAAIEQLKIWGDRTNAPVISRSLGSDSSGLAFDAWQIARDDGCDVMIMDTAGRLQNKSELMAELEKIIRVLKKQDPSAPHTVLLTLDATTGQNALNQVEVFGNVAGVNGLIMTKLDGSARGGILVAISAKFDLPVYFVGVGEQVEDLEPFEARDFARSIAGLDS